MCDDKGDARCGPGGGGGAAAVPAWREEFPQRHFQPLHPAVQGHPHRSQSLILTCIHAVISSNRDIPLFCPSPPILKNSLNALICLKVFFCYNYTSVFSPLISVGKIVKHLSLSLFGSCFLGSEEHAGFLYVQSTLQSLQGLPLPNQPYLFGLLVHRAEVAWAKAFPLRLMLRLGAEYRCEPGVWYEILPP